MDLSAIDWTIIVLFLAISLYIGVKFKNQADGSLANFFLGGRNLPWYIAGISMVATTFAADTPLAVAEMVSENGISKNWLWWSFLIGGMFTTFFFSKLWRRANILTELEFIDLRYSGTKAKGLRIFKSVYLGLFMNCMVIGWVNLAFITLLQTFFGLDQTDSLLVTGGVMVIAVIYSSLSGLLGIAITDSIQFFIALGGTIILAYIVMDSPEVGGIENLKAQLPSGYFDFFPSIGASNTGDSLTTLSLSLGAFLAFVTIQWWASWYPGAEPGGGGYIAQRMMSAKTERDSLKATLFFQIAHYCLRPWPWILVGLAAIYLYSPQYQMEDQALAQQIITLKESGLNQTALIQQLNISTAEGLKYIDYLYQPRLGYVYAMKDFLPTGLKGLLLVAFLAAYLSTISTQLNTGASFLVNDLYIPLNDKKTLDEKKLVFVSRIMTFVIMIIGLWITTLINSISHVWEFIMQAGAGLGAVLIIRWFWWRVNAWSEISAMIFPFIGYMISHYILEDYFGETFTANKGTYISTVIFTTIGWITVTYLTSPTEDEKLTQFYQRVKPMGAWGKFKTEEVSKIANSQLIPSLFCWIFAVVMTYSILFASGCLLLHEWTQASIWLGTAIIGFIGLENFMRKLEF